MNEWTNRGGLVLQLVSFFLVTPRIVPDGWVDKYTEWVDKLPERLKGRAKPKIVRVAAGLVIGALVLGWFATKVINGYPGLTIPSSLLQWLWKYVVTPALVLIGAAVALRFLYFLLEAVSRFLRITTGSAERLLALGAVLFAAGVGAQLLATFMSGHGSSDHRAPKTVVCVRHVDSLH